MLVNIDTPLPRMIFVYARGTYHFPLIKPLAEQNPDYAFYLHSERISAEEYRKSCLYALDNVYFVRNLMDLKFKLDLFGAFITTDAHATYAHQYSLRIICLFNRIGVPVFELQHGMFQIGWHYYDKPCRELIAEDSLPTRTFADHLLAYYPPSDRPFPGTVIGYPPCPGGAMPSEKGEYALVLSNLHWKTYAHEEKRRFYEAVFEHAARHVDVTFVWKFHHGELVNPAVKSIVNGMFARYPELKNRILFHHENEMLSCSSVSELIRHSSYVISTVSTVLLDCEMFGKTVAVYGCRSNECLTRRLPSENIFKDIDSLERICSEDTAAFKSGLLLPYDNEAFRGALDQYYHRSNISRREWLSIVVESLFPTNADMWVKLSSLESELAAVKAAMPQPAEP